MFYLIKWLSGNVYLAADVPDRPGAVVYLNVLIDRSAGHDKNGRIFKLTDIERYATKIFKSELLADVLHEATLEAL